MKGFPRYAEERIMSDAIHLSLWFPSHQETQILSRLGEALRLFPASADRAGVLALRVLPIDWTESPVLDERFPGPLPFEEVLPLVEEFVHDDYAFEFEVAWDLWQWDNSRWEKQPNRVILTAFGDQFADGVAKEQGHLLFDLGSDELFLAEHAPWSDETRHKVQLNVAQLLTLTHRMQAEMRPSARLLWSEDESDLAQKLIARLQHVQ